MTAQARLFDAIPDPLTPSGDKKRKPTPKRGYFAIPGSGPTGETCATCRHAYRNRRWAKCERARAFWTHGPGSDILLRSPACSGWAASVAG